MHKHLLILTCIASSGLVSSCCISFNEDHAGAYCRQVKSQLLFDTATGNIREQEIQRSEQPLEQNDYNQARCEDYELT